MVAGYADGWMDEVTQCRHDGVNDVMVVQSPVVREVKQWEFVFFYKCVWIFINTRQCGTTTARNVDNEWQVLREAAGTSSRSIWGGGNFRPDPMKENAEKKRTRAACRANNELAVSGESWVDKGAFHVSIELTWKFRLKNDRSTDHPIHANVIHWRSLECRCVAWG